MMHIMSLHKPERHLAAPLCKIQCRAARRRAKAQRRTAPRSTAPSPCTAVEQHIRTISEPYRPTARQHHRQQLCLGDDDTLKSSTTGQRGTDCGEHLIVANVTSAWFGRGKVTFWMLPKREHSLRILESVMTCRRYLWCPVFAQYTLVFYYWIGAAWSIGQHAKCAPLGSLELPDVPTDAHSAASNANKGRVPGRSASCPRRSSPAVAGWPARRSSPPRTRRRRGRQPPAAGSAGCWRRACRQAALQQHGGPRCQDGRHPDWACATCYACST